MCAQWKGPAVLRILLGVAFGYVAIMAFVFVSFSLVYLAMGPDTANRPNSYEVSAVWVAVSFVLGFVAALAGGWVAAVISHRTSGPKVLAALVLLLGLVMAISMVTSTQAQTAGPRPADVGAMEAMQKSITPVWVGLLNPLVGAAGVLLGGRFGRRGRSTGGI